MVRIVDHAQRRNMVLAASVNAYINSAEPVSSEKLTHDFGLSSATVRNILAELEEAELLPHPHTSAGRIPTDKGYRYYVDFLILSGFKLFHVFLGMIGIVQVRLLLHVVL